MWKENRLLPITEDISFPAEKIFLRAVQKGKTEQSRTGGDKTKPFLRDLVVQPSECQEPSVQFGGGGKPFRWHWFRALHGLM